MEYLIHGSLLTCLRGIFEFNFSDPRRFLMEQNSFPGKLSLLFRKPGLMKCKVFIQGERIANKLAKSKYNLYLTILSGAGAIIN